MSTYRPYTFASLHAARDAAIANITASEAAASGFPLDHLIDDRSTTLHKFTTAAADHWVEINRQDTTTAIDRIIVPSGHNWAGTVRVETNSVDTWPGTVRKSFVATPGVPIDLPITSNSDAWIRIIWESAASAWETPQLVLTTYVSFGGSVLFGADEYVTNSLTFGKPNGMSPTLELGGRQRRIELEYSRLAGSELGVVEDFLEAVGTSRPFWVSPQMFADYSILDEATDASETTDKDLSLTTADWTQAGSFSCQWGTEVLFCTYLTALEITILGRGLLNTTAVAHNVGEAISVLSTDTARRSPHELSRWMKFEGDVSSEIQPFSIPRAARTKSFSMAMRDNVD